MMLGTMGAMANTSYYTTSISTPRTATVDNGATSYRQVGYDTGSMMPYDDATCWAKGSGSTGLTRSLYAKTTNGTKKTNTTACTGYTNKVTVTSTSSGIDKDESHSYAIIGGYGTDLVSN